MLENPSPRVESARPDPLADAYRAHSEARAKRDLKKEHSALLAENSHLKATISELVKMQSPPELLIYKQALRERSDAIACAIASDWHVEEVVRREAVHGLNEYNPDIAKLRAQHFFQNLLRLTDIMARDSNIKTIYLAMLGDFFSGWIHEELMAGAAMPPGDAANFWKGLFVSGLDFLLRESPYNIEADCIPGNHGRLTDKMHFSDPTGTSLETFAYHALAGRYEGNPRVNLRVATHGMVYRTFYEKFTARLIHGYEIRYGGGIGGATIPIRKRLATWNRAIPADVTLMGHLHTDIDGGDFVVNSSLIGQTPWAQANGFGLEEPTQTFFLVHQRKGGQRGIKAPIWLDKSSTARAA